MLLDNFELKKTTQLFTSLGLEEDQYPMELLKQLSYKRVVVFF